jgi:ABC-2 type transport system permease protein
MNRALWSKAIGEARLTLAGCALLMFLFNWLFVWITGLIPAPEFTAILDAVPAWVKRLPGIPIEAMATYVGRISMGYLDPVVYFLSAAWAVARGSDCVSGEIGRGTMEMLLAQPVRRIAVLGTQATVMLVGAAILAASAWLGTWVGLALVEFDVPVDARAFAPAAGNLFALTFFTAGLATLASSWDRYRWRTIGLVVSVYLVAFIMKVMGRMVESLEWLLYFTFHGAYQPQLMVTAPERAWELSLQLNGVLIGLGLAAYVLAAVIFCRRDLPAPL